MMLTKYLKPVMFKDKDGNYVYEILEVSADYYHSVKIQEHSAPSIRMLIDKRQREILNGEQ